MAQDLTKHGLATRDALVGASLGVAFIHAQLAWSTHVHLQSVAPDVRLLEGILLLDAVHALAGALLGLLLGWSLRRVRRGLLRGRTPRRADRTARASGLLLAASTGVLGVLLLRTDHDFQIQPDGPPPPAPASLAGDRPNILLIVADSLRRDVFDDETEARRLAPCLMAFRTEACDYTAHQAVCSWTPPSMAGILTGLYPRVVGAHGGRLTPDATTLAERLSDAGYETVGISDNYLTSPEFGYAQGHHYYWQKNNCAVFSRLWFNHWRLFRFYEWFFRTFGYQYRGAPIVNERVIRWAEQRDRARPFYLMVHYMDTHYPYYVYADEPQNESNRSTAATYTPYYEAQLLVRDSPKPPFATGSLAPERLEDFQARYRGSLQYLDRHIGHLFDWLRRTGEWDRTLVMFTADHGEEFFEHHYLGHGRSLYQESTRVPLMVKWPRVEGVDPTTIDVPVSHLQITPTILHSAGIEPDAALLPELPTRTQSTWMPVFSEFDRSGVEIYAGRFDRFKLTYSRTKSGRELLELYDLHDDPGERENLEQRREALPEEVLVAFESFVERLSTPDALHPSPGNDEELRSLGYLH